MLQAKKIELLQAKLREAKELQHMARTPGWIIYAARVNEIIEGINLDKERCYDSHMMAIYKARKEAISTLLVLVDAEVNSIPKMERELERAFGNKHREEYLDA